jgi:L-ascorbate metabolism protein UlaG (beta-lactamase superfamily)
MATELTFLGHASWAIKSGDANILLDPFLSDSPVASCTADSLQADHILVTHGHFDHVADVAPIANRTGATVVAMVEVAQWFANEQKVASTIGMNLGGTVKFPFGSVKMTPAWHSSELPDGSYGGLAGGFLVKFAEGTVYFAGDTALFSDMQLIARAEIDIAILPIGDHFTMGPDDSLEAIKFLQPKRVVPNHYNTWPPICQDAGVWAERVKAETDAEPVVLEPGQRITL